MAATLAACQASHGASQRFLGLFRLGDVNHESPQGHRRAGLPHNVNDIVLDPHVDAYMPGIETARKELSFLTDLSDKISRARNFPHRLPHVIGWIDAASDKSLRHW